MMLALALVLSLQPPLDHVTAARAAAITYRVSPAILLAIAEHETHFDSTLTNGRSCGAMQVATSSKGQCQALADVTLSYLEGARVLRQWLDAAHGNLRAGLRGYARGWEPGAKRPADHANGFDSYVIAHARAYAREAAS